MRQCLQQSSLQPTFVVIWSEDILVVDLVTTVENWEISPEKHTGFVL